MATCKDCFHFVPCLEYGNILDPCGGGVICDCFNNKADVMQVNWISVDDKLPVEDTRVLVAVAHSTRIDTDRIIDGRFVRWGEYVTHWQTLPELPRTLKERGGEDMSVEQIFYCSNLECVKEECPRHYKHIDVCYKPQEARDFSDSDECLNREESR